MLMLSAPARDGPGEGGSRSLTSSKIRTACRAR
jgi:hypothetical protein